MCVSAAVGEYSVIDESDFRRQRGKRMVSRDFFIFWKAVFHFVISKSPFHFYHLYECNALSVKNVDRLITVWWSKA